MQRFADANLDRQQLGQLFTQAEWEEAVRSSFGEKALARTEKTPHPDLMPSISRPCRLNVPLATWPAPRKRRTQTLCPPYPALAGSMFPLQRGPACSGSTPWGPTSPASLAPIR